MHRAQQRQSKVLIYINCEGDDIDLREDDDGDGDDVVDDEEDTSPHAKGVPVAMTVSNSPWQRLGAAKSALFWKEEDFCLCHGLRKLRKN
jgi:hypothetical protein